jgi:cell wall assembly regulator SMI1
MSSYEMLRVKWMEAGVAVNDPASPAALDRFEKKYHISLPSEFKDYLLTVNGMQDGQVDKDLVSFLSLEAIDQGTNCKEISATELEMVVADFSIYSHFYVLRVSRSRDRSPVFVTDGEHEKEIAGSFKDFVNHYLSNPTWIAHCWN